MSFAFNLPNYISQSRHTPQEQKFLEVQSEFISSVKRVQVWINTFVRTSEPPSSDQRHLKIMQDKFKEIEGIYSNLSSHFLENEAKQSLRSRLEDELGIIKPAPRQDILDYLNRTFIQKRDAVNRCELSIYYNGIDRKSVV